MENSRKNKAMALFQEGFNCSQSVVLAFSDLLPSDPESLAKMSSSFGGGIGRMREVCGSVSGMAVVAGYLYGYSDPKAKEEKAELYKIIQELAHNFEEINGSIICRELLNLDVKHDSSVPSERNDEYYKKRPCKELVGIAAEILDKFITENKF